MTPALETYLAEVEAAEAAMTPGSWVAADDELHEAWAVRADGMYICATRTEKPLGGSSDIGQPDAHGIALLRNRVKALCGMVRVMGGALGAASRIVQNDYSQWQSAGGPDECPHGFATGIACRKCDEQTIAAAVALIAKGQGEGRESQPVKE